MQKLATGSSISKAWAIIHALEAVTSKWDPPVLFCVVLPRPDKVEIYSSPKTPIRPQEKSKLKEIIKNVGEAYGEQRL